MTALEKTWHTEHFFCAQCGQQFGEDGFHERDGKPYCRTDYFDMFAPKCGGCSKPIMENYISALNTQWHPDCFVCKVSMGLILGLISSGLLIYKYARNRTRKVKYTNVPKCTKSTAFCVFRNLFYLCMYYFTQDCEKPVKGKSFYAMEGKPVCPKCVGVDEDE